MTVQWREDDVVAKGVSTRPVRMATGEIVRFTREALEGMAEQVRKGFVSMTLEHLSLLPPAGRWHSAEVVTAEDGSDELVMYGRTFRTLRPVHDDPDPWALLTPDDRATEDADVSIASVELEPRNFDPTVFEEAKQKAPIAVHEENRWSELPPLEWVLVIPVLWGATKFLGSFLDELGRESARGIVTWVSDLASRAKDADRDRLVTLRFALPGGDPIGPLIFGFVIVEQAADLLEEVMPALEAATPLAELAGAQAESQVLGDLHRAAFVWKDGEWHLAWLVIGDEDAVRVTNWFLANEPDPARFLGRPLFPEPPSSDVPRTGS